MTRVPFFLIIVGITLSKGSHFFYNSGTQKIEVLEVVVSLQVIVPTVIYVDFLITVGYLPLRDGTFKIRIL